MCEPLTLRRIILGRLRLQCGGFRRNGHKGKTGHGDLGHRPTVGFIRFKLNFRHNRYAITVVRDRRAAFFSSRTKLLTYLHNGVSLFRCSPSITLSPSIKANQAQAWDAKSWVRILADRQTAEGSICRDCVTHLPVSSLF